MVLLRVPRCKSDSIRVEYVPRVPHSDDSTALVWSASAEQRLKPRCRMMYKSRSCMLLNAEV